MKKTVDLINVIHHPDFAMYSDRDGDVWRPLWHPEDEFNDVTGWEDGGFKIFDKSLKVELLLMVPSG